MVSTGFVPSLGSLDGLNSGACGEGSPKEEACPALNSSTGARLPRTEADSACVLGGPMKGAHGGRHDQEGRHVPTFT